MGSSAASIDDVSDGELRSAKFQLLFRSAEKISVKNIEKISVKYRLYAFMLISVQRF